PPMKRVLNPKALYFGTPVVLISSFNSDGSTNVAPISSAWWMGQTAVLGMSDAVDRLALLTGRPDVPEYKQARGYRYEADKFAAAGLTPVELADGFPLGVAESLIQM